MAKQYVRRDIWKLARSAKHEPWDPHTLAYAEAVGVMKERDPDDPTSWTYQAAMHGAYKTPADPLWNGCQHGSWFFLPWHRIYILYFERIVRAIVTKRGGPDDWALPYWNYTNGPPGSRALPRAFAEEKLPNGKDNPLYTTHRNSRVNAGAPLDAGSLNTSRALSQMKFSPGFGGLPKGPIHFTSPHGALESEPHDNVHVLVGGRPNGPCLGGLMIDPNCAARDAIFYLHHSNIDRLWAKWLSLGKGRSNPANPQWTDTAFEAFDAEGIRRTKTCGQVAELADLDYTYDDLDHAPEALRPGPADEAGLPERPGGGPEIAAGDGAELGLGPASVTLGPVGGGQIADAARASDADAPRVYLHLEEVAVDETPEIVWEVWLDPDGPGSDPENAVGTISFFGRGHAHGGEPAETVGGVEGERFIFDITEVVRRLEDEGRWDDSKITVSFRPLTLEGVSASEFEVPTVRVGRVYVTRG